jgi:hypothetical protein
MGRRGLTLLAAAAATILGVGAVIAGSNAGILPTVPWTDLIEWPESAGALDPAIEPELDPEASYPPAMAVDEVYERFATLGSAASYGDPVTLATADAGHVVLPSGRLVATDAMLPEDTPFTTTVPPGRHPVSILTADFPASDDHRVAAAMVRVAEVDPVTWELALVDGQDASDLGPDEYFGYGVDSGSGAFMSPEAAALLADEAIYDDYSERALDGMFPDDQTIIDSVVVEVDAATGANVVTFSSGFGDGSYPTYVGLDGTGAPVVFVTDFGLLDEPGG